MQSYQEEYIANIKEITSLTARRKPEDVSFDSYVERLLRDESRRGEIAARNMELLRSGLTPAMEHILTAKEQDLRDLEAFAAALYGDHSEQDVGLFCQIHQSLLSLARQKRDRSGIIRELYWLGIGRHSIYTNELVGLDPSLTEHYMSQMRLCFAEAAAYMKYFEEIKDSDTRAYILRASGNQALGLFKSVGERTRLLKRAMEICKDKSYQEMAPELPWDRYIMAIHSLMASSISYSKERAMTPEDVSDIMESVQIVYSRQVQAAKKKGTRLPCQHAFHYYAIEHYCGIYDLDYLLTKMESLMDAADPTDYSKEGMYGLISLPAFYCQYLGHYPEHIPEREMYIAGIYRRMLRYVASFPAEREGTTLFLYLRQLSFTFVETENTMTYGEFLKKLLIRFVPTVYIHSQMVGETAKAFCALILDEEPGFFDDIEEIRAIEDPSAKREAVLSYAEGCGSFHDVGKINFLDLYDRTARQWLEAEYELAHLHTVAGWSLLLERPSTRRYASAALGHHAWYDGARGYPESYKRLEHPERQMVDIIGLIDWLVDVTNTERVHTGIEMTFDEAVESAIAQEGRRFSPLLTARLRDKWVAEQIRDGLERGRWAAYRQMYEEAES